MSTGMSKSTWRCLNQLRPSSSSSCSSAPTIHLYSRNTGSVTPIINHQTRCLTTSNKSPVESKSSYPLLDSLRSLIPDQGSTSVIDAFPSMGLNSYEEAGRQLAFIETEPHHLHVYSHRHNTHITLTKPNRDSLISLSTGNVGFKKHQRGSYEAAFQLTSYVLRAMTERGYLASRHKDEIKKLEVIFRGFGEGRGAFQTALLGVEGRFIRSKIITISDATKLKIGGDRAPKPRRL